MDKINNIKSAVASAISHASNPKGVQPLESKNSPSNKAASVKEVSRTKGVTTLQSESVASTKTLAKTLKSNEEKVKAAVEEINNELVKLQSELGFSVDKVANDVVITVKRKESGEVVRQIPSEAALKLAHNFEKLKGVLLDKTF